jgi:hypothetical protein
MLRKIMANITAAKQYVIVGESADSARRQQLSIYLRWIDSIFVACMMISSAHV